MNDDDERNAVWNIANRGADEPRPSEPPTAGGFEDPPADLADPGALTLSELLGTTARVLGAHFGPLLGIVLLTSGAAGLLSIGITQLATSSYWQDVSWFFGDAALGVLGLATMGAGLLQMVLQFFAQAAVGYATVERMAGRPGSVGRSLAAAFTHHWPIAALAVLNSLAIGFGALMCLIPGIILGCVLFASVPSAVVERLGPIEAMQRSADLTRGHRVTIFLAMVVIGFAYMVIAVPLMFGVIALGDAAFASASPLVVGLAAQGLQWGGTLLFNCVLGVLAAVFYGRARGVRDGVDADAIAKVFA